jgi:succinyl-CoA synthetase beta subunit
MLSTLSLEVCNAKSQCDQISFTSPTDKNVKAILVNVFGGIVNCATIAKGIVNACHHMKLNIPLIVRLEGKLLYHVQYLIFTTFLISRH